MGDVVLSDNETVEEVRLPRTSALLCWPVEIMPSSSEPGAYHHHVTALYIHDITGNFNEWTGELSQSVPKEWLLRTLREDKDADYVNQVIPRSAYRYRLMDVSGVAAFGPDENVPVLRFVPAALADAHLGITHRLREAGIKFDATYTDFNYKPHCTVSLPDLISPPKQVLLRPLELWYKDDEPVVV